MDEAVVEEKVDDRNEVEEEDGDAGVVDNDT